MGRAYGSARAVHCWVGALFALYVLVIGLSGTLLLWKSTFVWFAIPAARADFEPTPEALASIARDIEDRFADREILQIQFPTETLALTRVIFPEARYAYVASSGELIDDWTLNERWEEWLYDLHHRLLLGDLGLNLTGAAGLVLIPLAGLGMIAFWPLRRGFGRGFWPRRSTRPLLLRAHRNVAILVAVPFLISACTGVLLAFPGWVDAKLEPIRRTQSYSDAMVEGLDDVSGAGTGEWLPALRRSLATFPGGTIRTATVPSSFNPYRIIGVQQRSDWHPLGSSQVYIAVPEGYMDVRIDAMSLPLTERAVNAAYPLHTGTVNLPWKLLLTASGAGLTLAGALGLLAFWRRLDTRRPQCGDRKEMTP